jgi:hypothetical protein
MAAAAAAVCVLNPALSFVTRRCTQGAGSTLCQLAMDAGELVDRDANCNLRDAAKRALAAGAPAAQCRAFRCASTLALSPSCSACAVPRCRFAHG